MISRFWDQLFKYADWLHKNGDMRDLATVHKIEDILQKVYDQSLALESPKRKDKRKAANVLERIVEGIADVEHMQDPTDGDEYYKFGGFRYNRPQDVLEAVLNDRDNVAKNRADIAESLAEASVKLADLRRKSSDTVKLIEQVERLESENELLKAKNKNLSQELKNTRRDYRELAEYIKKGKQ